MKFTVDEAINEMTIAMRSMEINNIIILWNDLFPHEEWISEKTFSNKTEKEKEELSDELQGMIIDEISSDGNDVICEKFYSIVGDEIELVYDYEDEDMM